MSYDKQNPKKTKRHKKWGGSEVPAKTRFEERSVPKGFNREFYDGLSLGAPFFKFYPIFLSDLDLLQRRVAGSCDNVVLLLFCKVDEANCITRNAYCEVSVLRFLWVSLAVLELLYAEDVYVQVV